MASIPDGWIFIPKVTITHKDGKVVAEVHNEERNLVLCKSCKHRPTREDENMTGLSLDFPDNMCPCKCQDGWYSWYPPDDWFCANGEPREVKNE